MSRENEYAKAISRHVIAAEAALDELQFAGSWQEASIWLRDLRRAVDGIDTNVGLAAREERRSAIGRSDTA